MRVLIVDDSSLFRRVLSEALQSVPDIEIVGTAPNGKIALQRIQELHPDVITLDMEMPEMDGLSVLDALRLSNANSEVIVVSALTRHGGELTMKALEKGAFDFITKPDTSGLQQSRESIVKELIPRLKALSHRIEIRSILHCKPKPSLSVINSAKRVSCATVLQTPGPNENISGRQPLGKPEFVLIGVSTGGPNALAQVVSHLPADIGVPVLIVQHMPPLFTQSLAESLSQKSKVMVSEAVHGEQPKANYVYIAPGGKQMRLAVGQDGKPVLHITEDPPENNCKPAVDYLFRSAANNFPGRAVAVIMTGMGSDGTLGMRLLKRHGCYCIAQDELSCVVFGMPKAAIEAGVIDIVLPLDQIASHIVKVVRGLKR